MDIRTAFAILGLGEGATPLQVRTAYRDLVKVWHPDRLPGALADVKDACARVFARILGMQKAAKAGVDEERGNERQPAGNEHRGALLFLNCARLGPAICEPRDH